MEVCLGYLITTEKFTVLTRQKSKLLHQIITDVLCTDGYCGFWGGGKAKAAVRKEAKLQMFINVLTQRWDLNLPQFPSIIHDIS